jgi:hypothetical protein
VGARPSAAGERVRRAAGARWAGWAREDRTALGDRPHDQALAAAHVAGDEHAVTLVRKPRRGRRCRARRARRRAGRAARRARGRRSPSRAARGRRELEVGALDLLERHAAVDAPSARPRGPRSARDVAVVVAEEALGVDRVDPLAALLVRRRDAVDHRVGRPRHRVSARASGGGAGSRTGAPTAAPWRCAVPRQSAPVSPPPMMTTCLPFGVIGARRRGRPPAPGSRRQVLHRLVDAVELAPGDRQVAPRGGAARRARPRRTASRRSSTVTSTPTFAPARNSVPSASICARRRSRWRFSILNSGMP